MFGISNSSMQNRALQKTTRKRYKKNKDNLLNVKLNGQITEKALASLRDEDRSDSRKEMAKMNQVAEMKVGIIITIFTLIGFYFLMYLF